MVFLKETRKKSASLAVRAARALGKHYTGITGSLRCRSKSSEVSNYGSEFEE